MKEPIDFERFEKQVKTFAQIKKKYERLLSEFYSDDVYKGSYIDRSTIEKAVELARQNDQHRTRAFAQQHLINHRIIEYMACLQVQIDNLHHFLNLMLLQMGKDVPKVVQTALRKLQEAAYSNPAPPHKRRKAKDRRRVSTRRLIYNLDYQGEERRRGTRRRKDRRKSGAQSD